MKLLHERAKVVLFFQISNFFLKIMPNRLNKNEDK